MSWLWGTSQVDDAIDKATSELLPAGAEDIALNLEICDQIRSKSVPAKDAMRALKRRLNHKNPNVQILALALTDICIKNGGDHFLVEVASREYIDNLVSILKIPALNMDVKNSILRHIQNWSTAFEGKSSLNYVGQTYKTLKNEGYNFPPRDLAVANSAMVDTQTAPEWIDSDVCLRCRTAFSFTNRKHHCRNCGQVFDQQCSSHTMALPHFGITQEVRVCDGCYNKLSKKGEKTDKGHRHSHSTRHRSGRDLADAELQRAIQLSLQEVGQAGSHYRPGYISEQPSAYMKSEPPLVDRSSRPRPSTAEEEDDPDLRAAIEASLREAQAPQPSAPIAVETPRTEYAPFSLAPGVSQSYPPATSSTPALPRLPNYDLEPLEEDVILTFSQTVEQVQAQGGKDMSRYPAVGELYDKANGLRPKLALSLDDSGRKEQMLSDMHAKLSEAVKLYDKLLTEQVSHPRWRPQQTYQPHVSAQAYRNEYTSWNPQSTPESPQQRPSQPAYAPSSPSQEYQPHRGASLSYAPAQSPQPWYQQSQMESMQQQQTGPVSRPANASVPSSSLPQQLQEYQHVQSTPVFSQPVSSPPPVSASTQPVIQSPNYSAPLHQPQYDVTPPSSNLSRHSTISYASQPSPQASHGSAHLSRSNTVPAHQYAQSPPPPRLQQQPVHLPQFPAAPTTAPQLPLFAPEVPTRSPQPERQEALLIDL